MKPQIFGGILLVVLIVSPLVSAESGAHPALLFDTIQDTPGYRYNTTEPWKSYQNQILRSADNSLGYDFSGSLGSHDRIMYRASYAFDLGLAYQITKKPRYAIKAREALLNLTVGTVAAKVDRANALGDYSLAYDFIQPTLDPATDSIIRDKLARLADTVYKELNDSGTSRSYVSFADYHGQAYPMVGIAGAALADYTNPNGLSLSSTPADWNLVGTGYLFVDDKLHSYGRSLFSFGFDEASGKHLNGAYKFYVLGNFVTWLQVYNHFYEENPFDRFPAAKRAFTSELWESLPNGYSNNYVTLGNTKLTYHRDIVNLLDETERANALNFDEVLEKSTILPYARTLAGASASNLYCVFENYSKVSRSYPSTTSYLDPDSVFQVIRGSWNRDADWLSLVTFNTFSLSNRDSMHGDQLSIEYYSRGDLLLADAGENKYAIDRWYGYYDIHHNTIAIENPRAAFPVSPWSNSASAGIFKGGTNYISTPVTVENIIREPWVQLIQASAPVTSVMTKTLGNAQSLSSPIRYERTLIYPESDYFIVVDRMEGTEDWVYRNIFRLTSLMVTPTVDTNKNGAYSASEVGHVNGALAIGSKSYDWLALTYLKETATGITSNSLTWTTTNPYGNAVRMDLVSAPASEILIEKHVGRVGGYDAKSEVFNPVVYFRTPATTSEYRVTALLSSYTTEEAKTATEIPVTGTGHALHVQSSESDDYIYTGTGISSFGEFTTDADTVFIRKTGQTAEFTLLGGSYLDFQHEHWTTLSEKADYITVKKEGDNLGYQIQADPDLQGKIFNEQIDPVKIKARITRAEQKNTAITGISFPPSPEIPVDLLEFLKGIVKRGLSFIFNI